MRTFTLEEIAEYIKAQPDDKLVNMGEPFNHNDCGCVMVQMGRDLKLDFDFCSSYFWFKYGEPNKPDSVIATTPNSYSIWELFNKGLNDMFITSAYKGTYGELKKELKPEFL
jgi:hypothetical protein